MTLIGETEIIRDLGDAAALSNPASCFLESQAQKIAVGRQSRRGLELADKLIATQAGKSRQGVKSGIIAQTRFHEIRDLCQSLPRQLARCLFPDPARGVVPIEMCANRGEQRFDE